MIGNNTITLNEATVIEALEYWMREIMFKDGKCPKVKSIVGATSNSYSKTFVVEVENEIAQ